jgi:hypothetical protein
MSSAREGFLDQATALTVVEPAESQTRDIGASVQTILLSQRTISPAIVCELVRLGSAQS